MQIRGGRLHALTHPQTDRGTSARQETLPHVFDRFYRGDPARGQQEGESGLGLAIAKSIIEAHGGRIEVASELRRGTPFTVLIL